MTDTGARVTSCRVVDRIVALRVPPAYTDVHIAVDPRASIQAWGCDARGRRQYRYHVRAVARSELRKYYRVTRLASDLPTIRATVTRDFYRHGLSKAKVAAGVVRLIAEGHLRIGSDRYARENHTYGTTTLHKRHARVNGGRVVLEAKRNVLMAIRIVAAGLGNTPAVCRKSYIHPIVPSLYVDRGLTISDRGRARSGSGPTWRSPSSPSVHDPWVPFSPDERALTRFLVEHFPDRRRKARDRSLRAAG